MAAVAVAVGSPVFSPSMRTLSCKANQESLAIKMGHRTGPDGSASSTLSPPPPPSSSSPSLSPFPTRFQKEATEHVRVRGPNVECSLLTRGNDCSSSSTSRGGGCSSSTALKRKRPARLNIPQVESPVRFGEGEKGKRSEFDVVEVDSTRYSVFCKRGRVREVMEDRYCAAMDIGGDSNLAFFGVFDGHGGEKAAEFVSKNIEKNVMCELSAIGGGDETSVIGEAVRTGYLITDSDLMREDISGGSCLVTALIRNNDLIVSNAGDCRAVLSRGGAAEALTSDHRPSREDERIRIEDNGGYVDCIRGVWRLQGTLAVSRGMGDAHLKQWVSAEPETTILRIEPECEFLILASDGLWDKVSNQEAVDMVRSVFKDSTDKASLLSACHQLAELSSSRDSFDDVSVMIIQLRHFS